MIRLAEPAFRGARLKKFTPGGGFPDDYVIDNAGNGQGTLINDSQPYGDDCSDRDQVQFSAANKNIGDLLNAKGVTWGFFQGGFKPTATKPDGTAMCGATHNIGAVLGGTGTSGAGFDAGPNEGAVADAGTRLRDAAGDLYLPCWVLVSALYVAVAVVVVPPVSHFDRMRRFGRRGDW